jgi:hypothetical protein
MSLTLRTCQCTRQRSFSVWEAMLYNAPRARGPTHGIDTMVVVTSTVVELSRTDLNLSHVTRDGLFRSFSTELSSLPTNSCLVALYATIRQEYMAVSTAGGHHLHTIWKLCCVKEFLSAYAALDA